ncbi:MAG TPA: PASTA domain-containing protein [Longimicrobiaceae bacterium]|nr:PASTA domain-containing protein [Longimicrobiaceae bacterium]
MNGRGPERPFLAAARWRLFFRVVGIGLGTFLLGYLLATVLVFPGFGRQAVVTVPDLRGRTLSAARGLADDAGVEVERGASLHHPTVPEGAVLAQSPLPGQEVTRGAAVRVTLSAGRERRPVPEVADLTAAQAEALLTRTGFAVRVRRVLSDRAAGRVLGVTPAPGTLVPIPGTVELSLSAGPPEVVVPVVAVPDVGGLPEAQAREALRSAGLRVGEVGYAPGSSVPLGGVASQQPAAGDSVRAGTAVNVTISGSPPTGSVPSDTAQAEPTEAPPGT